MSNAFLSSGLFGDLMRDPAIAAFFSREAFCRHMLRFEIAWTNGLVETGQINGADAEVACQVMRDFVPDWSDIAQASDRDGLPVPGLVRALKNIVPQGTVHTGATSQDVIDTAMVLTLLLVLEDLGQRLDGLVSDLDALQARHGDGQMMGRTRMQAALPIPVSHRIESWIAPLRTQLRKLPAVAEAAACVQIGGPVGTLNTPGMAQVVARGLGLRAVPAWHTDRTRFVDAGQWITTVLGALGKIGSDISLMAQQGIDDVRLSGGGGSSAMPHKQNPVRAEVMVALARYAPLQQSALTSALMAEQERSGVAWAIEWMALPQLCELCGTSLRHGRALVAQIEGMGNL